MDKFQSKLDFDFKTNQLIVNLISYVDSFRSKWNFIEDSNNRYLRELNKICRIESTGSSTRIEGSLLTNTEIQNLLEYKQSGNLKTKDEQAVSGYYDVLVYLNENFKNTAFTDSFIQQMHLMLLKYSEKDERHRGIYKSLSNKIIANYPDGTQNFVYITTKPQLVESEMSELFLWTNKQFDSKEIHPLLVIALFIYEILSIHPFQDGNGRLSRLLTSFLLLQKKYYFISCISFEKLLEQKKKQYFESLMDGQKNRNSENEKIDRWIIFFLNSLKTLIQKLEQYLEEHKSREGYLNERQKKIRYYISSNQPIKLSDIVNRFSEISINTIKKDLQYLKTEGLISSFGKNRGTVYMSNEK